ncbi:hypothetical protein FC652_16480, partial [Vibrio sp. 05-20-BW147]|uniref:hypothetical protein n=1 Tax=Vibrio sp. 05-20-BW147 TaxID=2575834 RepID=UPI001592B7BD
MYKIILGLTGSSLLGQGVAMLLLIITTKYYSQADFGEYGYYVSLAGLLSFLFSLRMDSFIFRMSDLRLKVMVLPILLGVLFSSFLLFIISIYFVGIHSAAILSILVYFTFFINFYSVYVSRYGLFKILGVTRSIKPISTSVSQLFFGVMNIPSGLLYGGVFGVIVPSLLFMKVMKVMSLHNKMGRRFKIAIIYLLSKKKDIMTITAQSVVNNVFINTLIFVFYLKGDLVSAGLIALLERVIRNPISMMVASIRNYSMSKVGVESHQYINYKKIMIFNILIALIVLTLGCFIFELGLFKYILTEQWHVDRVSFI